jgi:hypothetical protein
MSDEFMHTCAQHGAKHAYKDPRKDRQYVDLGAVHYSEAIFCYSSLKLVPTLATSRAAPEFKSDGQKTNTKVDSEEAEVFSC